MAPSVDGDTWWRRVQQSLESIQDAAQNRPAEVLALASEFRGQLAELRSQCVARQEQLSQRGSDAEVLDRRADDLEGELLLLRQAMRIAWARHEEVRSEVQLRGKELDQVLKLQGALHRSLSAKRTEVRKTSPDRPRATSPSLRALESGVADESVDTQPVGGANATASRKSSKGGLGSATSRKGRPKGDGDELQVSDSVQGGDSISDDVLKHKRALKEAKSSFVKRPDCPLTLLPGEILSLSAGRPVRLAPSRSVPQFDAVPRRSLRARAEGRTERRVSVQQVRGSAQLLTSPVPSCPQRDLRTQLSGRASVVQDDLRATSPCLAQSSRGRYQPSDSRPRSPLSFAFRPRESPAQSPPSQSSIVHVRARSLSPGASPAISTNKTNQNPLPTELCALAHRTSLQTGRGGVPLLPRCIKSEVRPSTSPFDAWSTHLNAEGGPGNPPRRCVSPDVGYGTLKRDGASGAPSVVTCGSTRSGSSSPRSQQARLVRAPGQHVRDDRGASVWRVALKPV